MSKKEIEERIEEILGTFVMMNDIIEKGKIWHVKKDEIEMRRHLNDCEYSLRSLRFDLVNYHTITDGLPEMEHPK